ncbi:MAG: hypothetical protein K2J40_09335 [Ruminococcus sp.]|nr:hypothetical protein [Ruminococcus sp.]
MEEEELQREILQAIRNIASYNENNLSIQEITKPVILKYIDNYPQVVAKKITAETKDEQLLYIKGLIRLYPLTARILDDVFSDEFNKANFTKENFSENVSEWFDITETMRKHFTRMISSIRRISFEELISQLKDEISEFENEKEEHQQERSSLAELQKSKSGIIREIEALKRETEELRTNTSDEELKRQKETLEAEKNALKKKSEENKNQLQKLKAELEKIKKPDNQKFDKALKEFSKVLATMPDDEAD